MPQVFIPPALRRMTGGQSPLQVEGTTVRQTIEAIDREFPGFMNRVCEDGRLKTGISVAIGSRISDLGLLEPVAADEEVHFVTSLSGG